MPRGQLNTNGVMPLADASLGTAGIVTGSERAKLQVIGGVVQNVLGSDVALTSAYQTILSVSLPAGSYIICILASFSASSAGVFEWRIRNATDGTNIVASDQYNATSFGSVAPTVFAPLPGTKTITFEAKNVSGLSTIKALNINSESSATFLQGVRVA